MTALPSKALRYLPSPNLLSHSPPHLSLPLYLPSGSESSPPRSRTEPEPDIYLSPDLSENHETRFHDLTDTWKFPLFRSLTETPSINSDWKQSIEDVDWALSVYPNYFKPHMTLMSHVLTGPGALPMPWRYYLAFMSAAAHKCVQIMEMTKERCLTLGGQAGWFKGQQGLPAKLRMIGGLNVKLAHRPWEVREEDLRLLLKTWTLVDLSEAVVILIQFHSLATFCDGLGVRSAWEKEHKASEEEITAGARRTLHNLQNYQSRVLSVTEEITEESYDEEDMDDRFELLAGGHVKYLPITKTARTFYASDFNWRDNGYELLERLLPLTSSLLNATIQSAFQMTDNCVGPVQQVNTTPLRQAVWKYTQKLYGLEYDDYDYREVSILLSKPTKSFLKKAACWPHLLTSLDLAQVDLGISTKDLIHLLLLVSEARKEVELIYWLHAFGSLA